MTVTAETKERFHFLDGLRGIAASMIVIHHAFTAQIVRAVGKLHVPFLSDFFSFFTQSGVDLFFVLSGVVLLRPYLRKQRPFNTTDYFYRRAKRIYPPYFFALLFGAMVVWFNNQYPTWYNERGLRAHFSLWETVRESVIVNFDGSYYNLAWWSLQIEILFYILAPLIIFIFPPQDKITTKRIALSIIITIVASFVLQNVFTEYFSRLYSYTYQAVTFGKFIEYPLCFLLGCYLAARDFNMRQGVTFVIAGAVAIVTGLILFRNAPVWFAGNFFAYEVIQNGTRLPAWIYLSLMHAGYGLLYAGIITLSFNREGFKRFLNKPVMIWLGERSYSLFLIHFSVFYLVDNVVSHFTTERNAYYGLLTRGIGIPLALFAAMLLFWFVERRQARGLITGNAFWPWNAASPRPSPSERGDVA